MQISYFEHLNEWVVTTFSQTIKTPPSSPRTPSSCFEVKGVQQGSKNFHCDTQPNKWVKRKRQFPFFPDMPSQTLPFSHSVLLLHLNLRPSSLRLNRSARFIIYCSVLPSCCPGTLRTPHYAAESPDPPFQLMEVSVTQNRSRGSSSVQVFHLLWRYASSSQIIVTKCKVKETWFYLASNFWEVRRN